MNLVAEATRRRDQVWRIIDAHARKHRCKGTMCPIVCALQQGSIALLDIVEGNTATPSPADSAKVSP